MALLLPTRLFVGAAVVYAIVALIATVATV